MTSPNPKELGVAERVANRAASKWTNVEREDLTSTLYLWLFENMTAVERWRNEPEGEGKLYVALRRFASKYARKETEARIGRPLNEGNFYTDDIVRKTLPFIFEDAPESIAIENPTTGQTYVPTGEFGLGMTILVDVRCAFHGLNREMKQVLEYYFREEMTFEEIGELRGITKMGAKKQVDRAVARLVDALAG